jgi:hypothetical protein
MTGQQRGTGMKSRPGQGGGPWVSRVRRAMKRVTPADGGWHRIDVAQDVHLGDGRVRLTFSCHGRTSTVELSAIEVDEALRAGTLLDAKPLGHG